MEFEDNKINGHVPGQIVLNPDGTTSGATVPDARTAGEKVHATIGTVRAMSRTMLFARDIHHGDRASLIRVSKGMATPNDGDMIPATTHPEVVKGILRGDQATCSDTEWLNDPYKRGMWSRGTAYLDEQGRPQGWVRMPDLNQAKEGSLPPPFARGGADAKAGSIGKDTMRRVYGELLSDSTSANNQFLGEGLLSSGAIALRNKGTKAGFSDTGSGYGADALIFDSALALPDNTGTEFAPWHIYGVSYSITSNGVMNEGAIDAEQVMGEVLLNSGRISALEARPDPFSPTRQHHVVTRAVGVNYSNPSAERDMDVWISTAGDGTVRQVYVNDDLLYAVNELTTLDMYFYIKVPPLGSYRVTGAGLSITRVVEYY